jgi:hypothetical protein
MKKNIRVHFSELLQCFGGEFVVLLFNKVKGDTFKELVKIFIFQTNHIHLVQQIHPNGYFGLVLQRDPRFFS